MRKFFLFYLILIFTFWGCQDGNIKKRLGGNVKHEKKIEKSVKEDKKTEKKEKSGTVKTVKEKRLTLDNENDFEVKEGVIIAKLPEKAEKENADVVITKNDDISEKDDLADDAIAKENLPPSAKVIKRVMGYRIQLLTVTDRKKAEEFGKDFKDKWSEAASDKTNKYSYWYKDDIPTYIEYYRPYWKLRIGNYKTRKDAEEMLKYVKLLGYKDAWIVKTIILVEGN